MDAYFAKGISLHKFDKSSSSMSKGYSQKKNPFVEKDYVRGKNLPFLYGLTCTKERLFIVTLHGDSKHDFSSLKLSNS